MTCLIVDGATLTRADNSNGRIIMVATMKSTVRISLFLDLATSYGRGLHKGIQRFRHQQPEWLLFTDQWRETGFRPETGYGNTDGIIAAVPSIDELHMLRNCGLPAVNLSNGQAERLVPAVVADDAAVGRMMAEHFLNLGHRRFAYVGTGYRQFSAERHEGFVARLKDAGFHCSFYQMNCNYRTSSPDAGMREIAEFLATLRPPLAIGVCNDMRARLVVAACKHLGWRVPIDAAIVGVDNDDLVCESLDPPLSSVQLDLLRMGEIAAAHLAALMRGEQVPQEVRVPPLGVINRGSSDRLATEDQTVAAALQFIRDQAHRGIRVQDVVDTLAVGRRTLEEHFMKAVGHSPAMEIRRVRLSLACELLRRTTLPVKAVADRCGYSSSKEFTIAFTRDIGATPTQYRREHVGIQRSPSQGFANVG